jgi:His/Glu/Gln/Arg/opine family amino acid ABC transporter permease subunit
MPKSDLTRHRLRLAYKSKIFDRIETLLLSLLGLGAVGFVLQYRTPLGAEKWWVVSDNFGFLMNGLFYTWIISISTFALGFLLAFLLAIGRRSRFRIARIPVAFIIDTIRTTPQLMLIFWTFFALPLLISKTAPPYATAIVAMTVIAAAYLAEVIRSGFGSVPHGQIEAGLSSGLSRWQATIWIVVPQAFMNMLPAIISQFVMHFKTSALLYVIGVHDFFWSAIVVNNREFASVPVLSFVAATYFVCCAAVSWAGDKWLGALDRGFGIRSL